MNVEAGVFVVGHFHHWRGRRHHHQSRAMADPIDMPVTVHRIARPAKRCISRTNQLPLISAVPMRSDSAFAGRGYSTTW